MRSAKAKSPRDRLATAVATGQFSLVEVTEHDMSLIYATERRYDRAAARLGVDWRALKQRLNTDVVRMYSDG
jgi:hypothetical protein